MPKLNASLHPHDPKKSTMTDAPISTQRIQSNASGDVPTQQTLPSENFFISAYHFFKQTISEFNPTPISSVEPTSTFKNNS